MGWNGSIETATKALWIRLFSQGFGARLWCRGLELAVVALLHVLGPERAQHRPRLF